MSSVPDEFDDLAWIDQRIAQLSGQARPPVGAEEGEGEDAAKGALGLLRLERYELTRKRLDLENALADLAAATRLTEHEDAPVWCVARGLAYAYRADLDESEAESVDTGADLDRAIEWVARGCAGPPHPDLDPAWAALVLADLCWGSYARRRSETGADARLDHLIERLTSLQAGADDAITRANLRMMLGAGYEERFSRGWADEDLDAAIALLEPVLAKLPPTTMDIQYGAMALVRAHAQRFERDDDAASLDRAIEVAGWAAGRCRPDDPHRVTLRVMEYAHLCQRLERVDDHRDRDAAIACLRDAADVHREPDPELAISLAELLSDRGGLYRDPDDLAAAALWFGVAANAGWDDGDAWYPMLQAANAYSARWELVADPEELPRLLESLTGAIAVGLPEPDMAVEAHTERLRVLIDLNTIEIEAGRLAPEAAAAIQRAFATEADAALTAHPEVDQDLRAVLAGLIAASLVQAAGKDYLELDLGRLRELLALARRYEGGGTYWQQLMAMVQGGVDLLDGSIVGGRQGPGEAGDFGVTALTEALRLPEFDADVTSSLARLAATARYLKANRTGDIGGLEDAAAGLYKARMEEPDGEVRRDLELVHALASMSRGARGGNPQRTRTDVERAIGLLRSAPDANPYLDIMGTYLENLRQLLDIHAGRPPLPVVTRPVPAIAEGVVGYLLGRFVRVVAAGVAAAVAFAGEDEAVRDAAFGELTAAVDGIGDSHPMRPPVVGMAALIGRFLVERRRGDADLLRLVVRWAEEAVALATTPGDWLWGVVRMNLAGLYRLRSEGDGRDRILARELGLAALRGRGWQVMVQSGVEYGVEAAADAAGDAGTVARWCLADGADPAAPDQQAILAELVQVLDAGRGLTLYAATAARRVSDELEAAGRSDLAVEWRNAGGQNAPGDLRHRVVRALTDRSGGSLVSPVDVTEITAALTRCGRDALVHLVPGTAVEPGYAVLVPASGPIEVLMLPQLTVVGSPLGWYLHTYHGSQLGAGGDFEAWDWALRDVCRWAWAAALGPMLARCRDLVPGRIPRLVLVPAGALGIVPWHAGWRLVDGGVRRYALQDVSLSYVASARLWCAAVDRAPIDSGDALVVGDPTGRLTSGVREAYAIHDAFYPDGRYLGPVLPRPGQPAAVGASGRGTPEEIMEWISAADTRAVLHAACHGVVDLDRPAEAQLELAGGVLRARELIELGSRTDLNLGTVLLAACTTLVAGGAYDEAVSLATAFLAAGARSVVGSLWAVPSGSTALLMYLVHHYLRDRPGDPGEALRRAQLWMLDPDRRYPDGMPAGLAEDVPTARLADPYRWAGFAHLGR